MAYTSDTLPATGKDIAVDRIAAVDFQRMKLVHGAEGVATETLAASGLPVALSVAGAALATSNPAPVVPTHGGAVEAASNPGFVAPVVAGAVVATANPMPTAPVVAGAVVSGTNPMPTHEPDQVFTDAADQTISADAQIFASSGSSVTRYIVVPPDADTGIRITFGGATATSTCMLLPKGFSGEFKTKQEIRGIKAGSASVVISKSSSVDS